jgi:hypothetical protein
MSTIINQDFAASGVAPVICVLEQGATGAQARAAGRKIEDYFVTSELSQPTVSNRSGGRRRRAIEAPTRAEPPRWSGPGPLCTTDRHRPFVPVYRCAAIVVAPGAPDKEALDGAQADRARPHRARWRAGRPATASDARGSGAAAAADGRQPGRAATPRARDDTAASRPARARQRRGGGLLLRVQRHVQAVQREGARRGISREGRARHARGVGAARTVAGARPRPTRRRDGRGDDLRTRTQRGGSRRVRGHSRTR